MKIKVKATLLGYDGQKRIRPGTVFEIEEKAFSEKWMEKLVDDKPSSEKKEKKEVKKDDKKEEKKEKVEEAKASEKDVI